MRRPRVIFDTMNLLRRDGSKPILEIAPLVAKARELEKQGLSVLIPVPFHRHHKNMKETSRFTDLELFKKELDDGTIRLLKSRKGRESQEHDDRWIMATALELNALILSNDGFANHSEQHWACESDFESWREEWVIGFTRFNGELNLKPKITPFGPLVIQEWAYYLQDREHWFEAVQSHIQIKLSEDTSSTRPTIRTYIVRDWILESFFSHELVVDTVVKALFLCGLGHYSFDIGYQKLLCGLIDVDQSESGEMKLLPIMIHNYS